ncbi:D-amino acid oxidase [Purpureocillium takamizusanense]|uniref:D-amino acid oxidase n=1 Tax=Purpureocillium takamizusanense TaxID=2060973 RepID=A0A9Q8QCI5_9HYPO|nr:D-amino acid oxidase [Purpureocillium takamizusanense]UNI17528.1 D-amino acid oxidase [Purpureocillium takamizusanense]
MADTVVVVVVGAGVSGLTSALLLSKNKGYSITVVAKHMPGDYHGEYASPFAGANIVPMADEAGKRWESETWHELKRLAQEIHRRSRDLATDAGFPAQTFSSAPWYRGLFDDYRDLPPADVLDGYDSASEYTGVCINTAVYLPWLVGQLLRNGVVVKRGILADIVEAKALGHTGRPASVIVNATGLGSHKLGGVRDPALYPVRGQTVLVRNETTPMVLCSGSSDGPGEELYVMQRAGGGGTVLGGTYDVGNWDTEPDPNVASRIMARAVRARPGMAGGRGVAGLSVIRHAVGLRPARRGGVRLEREALDGATTVVHNYGHGGFGYQSSYGYAAGVVELVGEIRRQRAAKL